MRQTLVFGPSPALALLATASAAVADALRRLAQHQARRRLARRTERSVAGLDAHALRDLGLTRCETGSVAGEIAGDVEATRRRVAHLHR